MEIRNALTVLTRLVKDYPSVKTLGMQLLERVAKLMEEEEREDIKVLASRYHAMLDAQLKNMVSEDVFVSEEKEGKPKISRIQKTKPEEKPRVSTEVNQLMMTEDDIRTKRKQR
jgi:hypothetical protein